MTEPPSRPNEPTIAVGGGTGHTGRGATLELTGARAVSFAGAAAVPSRALGRTVTYQPVTVEEYAEGAVESRVSREEATMHCAVCGQIVDGRNAHATHATDTVERVWGRPATDFSEYVRRGAMAGTGDMTEPEAAS